MPRLTVRLYDTDRHEIAQVNVNVDGKNEGAASVALQRFFDATMLQPHGAIGQQLLHHNNQYGLARLCSGLDGEVGILATPRQDSGLQPLTRPARAVDRLPAFKEVVQRALRDAGYLVGNRDEAEVFANRIRSLATRTRRAESLAGQLQAVVANHLPAGTDNLLELEDDSWPGALAALASSLQQLAAERDCLDHDRRELEAKLDQAQRNFKAADGERRHLQQKVEDLEREDRRLRVVAEDDGVDEDVRQTRKPRV